MGPKAMIGAQAQPWYPTEPRPIDMFGHGLWHQGADVVGFPTNSVRATLTQPQVTWAEEVTSRLNHVCALPPGWDGYHGRPTRFDVAEFAIALLRRVCKPHTPAPVIIPLPSGGLQIEWHHGEAQIELSIRAPYNVDVWMADPPTGPEGEEAHLTTDFTSILPFIYKLG
jgi:hypothetical protein